MTFPLKRFIQNPDYYLAASDELPEAGALAPGVVGAEGCGGSARSGALLPGYLREVCFFLFRKCLVWFTTGGQHQCGQGSSEKRKSH